MFSCYSFHFHCTILCYKISKEKNLKILYLLHLILTRLTAKIFEQNLSNKIQLSLKAANHNNITCVHF